MHDLGLAIIFLLPVLLVLFTWVVMAVAFIVVHKFSEESDGDVDNMVVLCCSV